MGSGGWVGGASGGGKGEGNLVLPNVRCRKSKRFLLPFFPSFPSSCIQMHVQSHFITASPSLLPPDCTCLHTPRLQNFKGNILLVRGYDVYHSGRVCHLHSLSGAQAKIVNASGQQTASTTFSKHLFRTKPGALRASLRGAGLRENKSERETQREP